MKTAGKATEVTHSVKGPKPEGNKGDESELHNWDKKPYINPGML